MKTIFAVIGVVLLVGLGVAVGANFGHSNDPAPAFTDTPLKKVSKLTLVEFTRSWNKTLEDGKGLGKGIVEYYWHFKYMMGIDVPKDWDWQIKRNNTQVSMIAPPLRLLNEPSIQIDKKVVFNKANGGRQNRMDESAKEIGLKALQGAIPALIKKDSLVYDYARLSLQDYLLNLLNQANPKLPITKLTISFSR